MRAAGPQVREIITVDGGPRVLKEQRAVVRDTNSSIQAPLPAAARAHARTPFRSPV
jgi:hypothetical protein